MGKTVYDLKNGKGKKEFPLMLSFFKIKDYIPPRRRLKKSIKFIVVVILE